ncbi:MAG: hypothetical protein AAFP17_08115 [Pseudomonadota bacterium]
MTDPKQPESGADNGTSQKPYAEMAGLNAEIARRRAEGEAPAAAVAPAAAAAAKAQPAPQKPPASGATPAEAKRANAQPAPAAGRSAASGWLALLVGLVVGAVGILAVGPSLAPHLPRPIADFLTTRGPGPDPADEALSARIYALEEAKLTNIDALVTRLEVVEDGLAGADAARDTAIGAIDDRLSKLGAALADAGSADAIEDLAALSQKQGDAIAELAAQKRALAAQKDELAAQKDELAAQKDAAAQTLSALGEDIAALGARIEALETAEPVVAAAAFAALADKVDNRATREAAAELGGRIAALENEPPVATAEALEGVASEVAALKAGLEAAKAAQAEAEAALAAAEREATLKAEATAITVAGEQLGNRLRAGDRYSDTLAELEALSGASAPAALARGSEGIVSPETLADTFAGAAQAAMRADIAASGEEGGSGAVLGWLQSQVTVRRTDVREGDDVEAVLSRVEAKFRGGDEAGALAEAEALPPHAQEASRMAAWIEKLKERVEAQAALDAWLAEIGPADNG